MTAAEVADVTTQTKTPSLWVITPCTVCLCDPTGNLAPGPAAFRTSDSCVIDFW